MPSLEENLALLSHIPDPNIWLKIGLRTFVRDGKKAIESIKTIADFKIFLDLKLYDIPNTMADAAYECAMLGVDMITLHSSSGERAMQAVMNRLHTLANPPLVMGVSVLTSFDESEFEGIYNTTIYEGVRTLARISKQAGINGMVCSVGESLAIKQENGKDFLTLTPGIRPFGESSDDQKRVATIQDAKKAESDFIVIGRPIYKATNPKYTLESIIQEMENQ